jgi:hypothetical protein
MVGSNALIGNLLSKEQKIASKSNEEDYSTRIGTTNNDTSSDTATKALVRKLDMR